MCVCVCVRVCVCVCVCVRACVYTCVCVCDPPDSIETKRTNQNSDHQFYNHAVTRHIRECTLSDRQDESWWLIVLISKCNIDGGHAALRRDSLVLHNCRELG